MSPMADIFASSFLCFDRRRFLLNSFLKWAIILTAHHFLPRCTQFYMSSELKIGTHHISLINIRYTILTQRNPCHFGSCLLLQMLTFIFIHCDDDNVRCYDAIQTARPEYSKQWNQTKTNTSQKKNTNKQILSSTRETNTQFCADYDSMKYQISQRHRLGRVKKWKKVE